MEIEEKNGKYYKKKNCTLFDVIALSGLILYSLGFVLYMLFGVL